MISFTQPPPLIIPSGKKLLVMLFLLVIAVAASFVAPSTTWTTMNECYDLIESAMNYRILPLTDLPSLSTPEWKSQLPAGLNSRLLLTKANFPLYERSSNTTDSCGADATEVFLIGTHHGLPFSVKHVKQLLETVEPDAILLEQCEERINFTNMDDQPQPNSTKYCSQQIIFDDPSFLQSAGSIRRVFDLLGKGEGLEFKAAYDYAELRPQEKRPPVVLIDRPISVMDARQELSTDTVSSARGRQPFPIHELYSNYSGESNSYVSENEMQKRANLRSSEAAKVHTTWLDFVVRDFFENEERMALKHKMYFPESPVQFPESDVYKRVVVQERDIYMACNIIQYCRIVKPKKIVVVIGHCHLKGVEHLLKANVIGSSEVFAPGKIMKSLLDTTDLTLYAVEGEGVSLKTPDDFVAV